jgi:2-oxoglutarate ferredoxin oxidoreductase subunit alpha
MIPIFSVLECGTKQINNKRKIGVSLEWDGKMATVVRIAGQTGDGNITLGEVFTKSLVRSGYEVFTFRTYPAEVRGGLTVFQVRFDREKVSSMGDSVDLALMLNKAAYDDNRDLIGDDCVLVYDEDACKPDREGIGLPLTSLSRDYPKNMVALGFIVKYYGLEPGLVKEVISERFEGKQALIDADVRGFEKGLEVSPGRDQGLTIAKPRKEKEPRLLISGNEAICLGALKAGLQYFAGYPITPASEILEFLAKHLPMTGGMVVQTEDEMAALGSVIGASHAGRKAMTATSGPGFALMQELIGFASMAEIPAVIVDCQRGGPSTGLPTKTEQSDLGLALFGSHGDAPRVVLAPLNVEDCYYQTVNAFNIAEELQLPVIIMSDQSIAHRLESVGMFRTDIGLSSRKKAPDIKAERFKRYELIEDGISPMPVPGENDILFITTGIEHDEYGKPNYEPGNRRSMMEKRSRKLEKAVAHSEIVTHGEPSSDIRLLSWGSTHGAVREAVARATESGISACSIHPKMLNPFPKEELSGMLNGAKHVIVPEVNFTGQFARLVRSELGIEVLELRKYEGMPFKPSEILKKIEGVAHG